MIVSYIDFNLFLLFVAYRVIASSHGPNYNNLSTIQCTIDLSGKFLGVVTIPMIRFKFHEIKNFFIKNNVRY